MEATEAGLQIAAATRDAAKRKREQHEAQESAAEANPKRARPIPVLKHEVEVPADFDETARDLDVARHGAEFDSVPIRMQLTCILTRSMHSQQLRQKSGLSARHNTK